jgi:hypothetical protein
LIEQAIRLAQEQQATLAQRLDAAQTQIEQEARNRR